jgi:hypothetical protein
LSVDPIVIVIFAVWAHLTASGRFRVQAQRPVIHDRRLEDRHHSRCRSATLHSLLGHPSPAAELGPPHGRLAEPQARTSTGLPRSARASCDRGGRLACARDDSAHLGTGRPPGRRLPLRNGLVSAPHRTSHRRGRPICQGFTRVRPSGPPQPVVARMDRAALGLHPRASHLADQEPDDARWGRGQAIEHGPGTTRPTHTGRSPIQ